MARSKAACARAQRLNGTREQIRENQLDREAERRILALVSAPLPREARLEQLHLVLPDSTPLRRAQRVIKAIKRASSTGETQREAIAIAVASIYPFWPKPEQVEAIWQLIFPREDMILIAKTSFGKSVPLQALALLQKGMVTFTIVPLNSIGGQQRDRVESLGGSPLFLSSKTNDAATRRAIEEGKYSHVYLSPELAASDGMRQVLSNPAVRRRIAAVLIDEAHLVDQWGRSFRREFARLHILRTYVGKTVPWFACLATLSKYTIGKLIDNAGFDEGVRILRTSIDRPELFLSLGFLPVKPVSKYAALRPFFDSLDPRTSMRRAGDGQVDCSSIPKTIVFFNTKSECHEAQDAMVLYLTLHPFFSLTRERAIDLIRVYTSDTHELDQADIVTTFAKPGRESSIRFVFATEALAMGVDLPDVRRIIQYKLTQSPNPAILWQRGGRACRDQQPGEIVLLVESWARGERSQRGLQQACLEDELLNIEGTTTQSKTGSKRLSDADRRCKLPDFWFLLINDASVCIKKRFLDHYEEPYRFRVTSPAGCCSNCVPERARGSLCSDSYAHYQLSKERSLKATAAVRHVSQAVMAWAAREASKRWRHARFSPTASCLLPSDHLRTLEQAAMSGIESAQDLAKALRGWRYADEYCESLFETISDAFDSQDLADTQTGDLQWHVVIAPELENRPGVRTGDWIFVNETVESMAVKDQQVLVVPRRRKQLAV